MNISIRPLSGSSQRRLCLPVGIMRRRRNSLGKLAQNRPELLAVRLEHAVALLIQGRDDEADAAYRSILRTEGLSKDARRHVEGFLGRIRGRRHWRVDFDAGVWYDDNVNNAPERETVAIPAIGGIRFIIDQQPVAAWVARTGVHLRWRRAGTESGRVVFETRASVSRNTAIGASAYNLTWANVSTGPRVQYSVGVAGLPRHGLFHADAGLERRWRGGTGYATSPWASIGLDQDISQDWRFTAAPRVWVTHRDREPEDSTAKGRSLALSVARRVGIGWLTVGGKVSGETAKHHSQRWKSYEASLRYAADFGRDWSLSVRAGLIRTRFDAEDRLFLKARGDQTRDVGITISHRALARGGYLPELTLNCTRTGSNIPLYNRELCKLQFGLRRLF